MKTQVLTKPGLNLYDQEMKIFIDKKLEDKVSIVDGKGLSTNDYNDEEKNTVAQNKVDIENLRNEINSMESKNEDIINTTETTLENSKEGGLYINEIYGKTEQNGTPNPSSPQEIRSVVINTIKTFGGEVQPYQESTITLSKPIELNGVNGVYDVATYEGVTRRFSEVVFDGSNDENWQKHTSRENVYFIVQDNKLANTKCLCTHYTDMQNANFDTYDYSMWNSGDFMIRDKDCSTLAEWKTKLQTNPITILYELSTPTTENFINADMIALNTLKTFEGTTYVETDSEVQPIIDVDYGCTEIGAAALESANNININKVIASSMNSSNSITYELTKEDGKIVLTGSDGSVSSVDYSDVITQTYIQSTQPSTTVNGSVWIE